MAGGLLLLVPMLVPTRMRMRLRLRLSRIALGLDHLTDSI